MIKLGQKVRDIVSGFEGIANCRTKWLNGGDRIEVQPLAKDGELKEMKTFDEPQLEVIGEGVEYNNSLRYPKYNNGDLVKDPVTKIEGIVIGQALFLYGCIRCCVQPKKGKDGKFVESNWFDEGRLELVKQVKQIVSDNPKPRFGPIDSKPTQNCRR